MFDQVLVAVDGSTTGKRGLEAAIGLAADQKATLTILHVVDATAGAAFVGDMGYVPASYVDDLLDDLRANGRKVLAKAEAMAARAGVSAKTVLAETKGGSIADAILGQARKLKSSVIVMGTHGRRGLRRVVMGSDAEAVVSEARVPVLLVRDSGRAAPASRARAPAGKGSRAA
jgi:nucleotide-binding universal stress UspA family protein